MDKISVKNNIKKCITYFLYICIIIGIIVHVVPFFYNRSLSLDESMLASSIVTRSMANLVSSPLDWGQSAPIGYLYIVKIFTLLFGTSKTVLRLWSLITSIASIGLVYLLLKDKVEKYLALGFTAFFSLIDKFIYYGNEFKPYMSDNFFCLLVLFCYQKYKENKLKFWQLIIIYSVIIWFSFSAVFFIAACMIIICLDFFKQIIKNKSKEQIKQLCGCGIVLLSFLLNYFFWLSKSTENAGGTGYWDLLKFPLIPTSLSDIKLIFKMVINCLSFYNFATIIMIICILVLYYFITVIKNKKDESKICIPFVLSLILLVFASALGFFPIQDRLVQPFILPLLIISAFACNSINNIIGNKKDEINPKRLILFYILFMSLGFTGMQGCKNLFPSHVYKKTEEVTKNISYLKENITEDDMIYVYRHAIPSYLYETDYDITYSDLERKGKVDNNENTDELPLLLPYIKGNTILGQHIEKFLYKEPYSYDYEINEKALKEDIDIISKYDSVYIFLSHRIEQRLISELNEKGKIEIVSEDYNSYICHFTKKFVSHH